MLEIIIAIILELIRAEPPERVHPTVWFGRIAGYLDRVLPSSVIAGIFPPLISSALALLLTLVAFSLPDPAKTFVSGFLLYSTISVRSMIEHARACIVEGKIDPDKLRMIVSRNVDDLEEWQRCSAVIESVAENFVDGVLAPLFYYSIFGLPGAMVYRAINTCDAMLGYRHGRYERFGKVSARLDDVLNFIPSRLSLILYAVLNRNSFWCGIRMSPKLNGHSISAMAGLLGVMLQKPGSYTINCGRKPEIKDVERCLRYFTALSGMAVILAVLAKMPV